MQLSFCFNTDTTITPQQREAMRAIIKQLKNRKNPPINKGK
jgi:hypothetical protein